MPARLERSRSPSRPEACLKVPISRLLCAMFSTVTVRGLGGSLDWTVVAAIAVPETLLAADIAAVEMPRWHSMASRAAVWL